MYSICFVLVMYIKHNYSKGRGWSAIPHVSDYFCPLCLASLALEMVKFSSTLVTWLRVALKGLPESLQSAKYKLASNFARSLKRQTQLMNLAQAARNALHGEDSLMQLRKDWNMMDLQLILANTLFALERKQISMEYLSLIPHCGFKFNALCRCVIG